MAELVPEPGSPPLDQSFVVIYGPETVAYLEKAWDQLGQGSQAAGWEWMVSLTELPTRPCENSGRRQAMGQPGQAPPSEWSTGKVCTRPGGSMKEALGLSERYHVR